MQDYLDDLLELQLLEDELDQDEDAVDSCDWLDS